MSIIAIDPGAGGGIAWQSADGVQCVPMPDGMASIVDQLRSIVASIPNPQGYIEKVGTYIPGNSGPSAATFARHCGSLETALYCLGVPTIQVVPNKWMKAIGSWPKDKGQRKKAIKEEMKRRFPQCNVTLKTADALGIMTYAKADRF